MKLNDIDLGKIELVELVKLLRETAQTKIDRDADLDSAKDNYTNVKATVYLEQFQHRTTQKNAERKAEADTNVQAALRLVHTAKKQKAEASADYSMLFHALRVRFLYASQAQEIKATPTVSEDLFSDDMLGKAA